jgi:hypothetical protein
MLIALRALAALGASRASGCDSVPSGSASVHDAGATVPLLRGMSGASFFISFHFAI